MWFLNLVMKLSSKLLRFLGVGKDKHPDEIESAIVEFMEYGESDNPHPVLFVEKAKRVTELKSARRKRHSGKRHK
jgi:hypothetical protein